MRCVEIAEAGGPEQLVIVERDIPVPGPRQIVIKVQAAGVNYPDVLQRQGLYEVPPGASDIPGLEVAGTVHSIGSGVTHLATGDPICALTPGGGYSEYALAPIEQCLPLPKNLSAVEAASLLEVYFTIWFNLAMQGNLLSAKSLLVHGGNGGIGSATIQLASCLGVDTYTTAGSEKSCEFCVGLGAKRVIDYRKEDFVDVILEETDGTGVDIVLDIVGGSYFQRNMECLAQKGRLINLYFLQGSKIEVDMMPVLKKSLTITGSLLRPQPLSTKSEIASGILNTVWPLLESGKINTVIDRPFPLAEASDAHKLMEAGGLSGKIVLLVD